MRKPSLVLFPAVALLLGGGAFLYLGAPDNGGTGLRTGGATISAPQPPRLSAEVQLDGKTVVRMTANGFKPANFHVHEGEVVVWVNEDSDPRWPASDLHPTHTIYPEFDPREPVMPGQAWEVAFTRVGTWRFHDHLKPYYTGNVEVEYEHD